jgi:hypothetical protein
LFRNPKKSRQMDLHQGRMVNNSEESQGSQRAVMLLLLMMMILLSRINPYVDEIIGDQ